MIFLGERGTKTRDTACGCPVIGRSTEHGLQSGILFGYSELCDGMVRRIHEECGVKSQVVATGGYADIIATHSSNIDYVNLDLTMVGLRRLWESMDQ